MKLLVDETAVVEGGDNENEDTKDSDEEDLRRAVNRERERVEQILDYQNGTDSLAGPYLVKWVDWEEDSNIRESETNLGCTELLAEFYKE